MYVLKSGLWICNRTRKTDFISEKSVLTEDFNYEIQIRIVCTDFFLYRLSGKSEKTDLQNCLVNSGLFSAIIMSAPARPLFLRTFFQMLFRITKKKERKKIQEQISQR